MNPIQKEEIYNAFNNKNLLIFSNSEKLNIYLKSIKETHYNLLMMSSGNFGGMNLEDFALEILDQV